LTHGVDHDEMHNIMHLTALLLAEVCNLGSPPALYCYHVMVGWTRFNVPLDTV